MQYYVRCAGYAVLIMYCLGTGSWRLGLLIALIVVVDLGGPSLASIGRDLFGRSSGGK